MQEKYRRIGFIVGAALFIILLFMPTPKGLSKEGQQILALTILMSVWWATEAIPIAITSMLPIVALPLFGWVGGKYNIDLKTSSLINYAHWINLLVIGTFMMAGAMVKWNLHKRIALSALKMVGVSPKRIVLGFFLATGLVSMWMSNTTATAMMLPIAIAIMSQADLKEGDGLYIALTLAIPYAASIGGISTMIGTTTNMAGSAMIAELTGVKVDFVYFLRVGLPFTLVAIPLTWLFFVKYFKLNESDAVLSLDVVDAQLKELGPMSKGEKATLLVFALAALAWTTKPLWKAQFPMIGDEVIAVLGALVLFLIPVDWGKGIFVLDEKTALTSVSWGTVLLIGGGLTIGDAFSKTGVAEWLASGLTGLEGVPTIILIIFFALVASLLSELCTNVVVTMALIPVVHAVALAANINPLPLLFTVTIPTSLCFMLPQGTPPNAIVYSSGKIKVADMIRTGFWTKLINIVIWPITFYFISMMMLGVH